MTAAVAEAAVRAGAEERAVEAVQKAPETRVASAGAVKAERAHLAARRGVAANPLETN